MNRRTTLAIMLAYPVLAQPSEDAGILEALDNYINGWNSLNPEKYADALYFPHLILDNGRITEYPTREQFVAKGKALWSSLPKEWHHSEWVKRQIVQRLGDTVHATGTWVRKDKAGKTIYTADVMYVMVKRDGKWKIFTRSANRGFTI